MFKQAKIIFVMGILLILAFFLIFIWEQLKSNLGFRFINNADQEKVFVEAYSQFVAINKSDKWILAEVQSTEIFHSNQFKNIGGLVIGETEARLEVLANFQFYSPFSELQFLHQDSILLLKIPRLYLNTPVAIETKSLEEETHRSWFGPNPQKSKEALRQNLSQLLENKGVGMTATVYPQAAEAIAQSFHQFVVQNNFEIPYKRIEVQIAKHIPYQFSLQNGNCGQEPCFVDWEIGSESRLIFKLAP